MLSYLKIANLAILDEVSIEPGPGFNVLTGETGAGKSIIVDAIGLLLGERGSADLVRSGSDRLVVEGQFESAARPDLREALVAAGLPEECADEDLIIRRELMVQEGAVRSRAMVSGRVVTLSALKALGEALADMHGQHQHQSLLRPEGQREALDAFAGAADLAAKVGVWYRRLDSLETEQSELAGRERERARQEEILRHQIREIEAASPRTGEESDLAREENLLRNASEVARLAGEAFALLSDDDDSAIARLGGARDRLRKLAEIDPEAARLADLLDSAAASAAEAAHALAGYGETEDLDPGRLEEVAARLAELDRLKRKYGASVEEVLAFLETARSEHGALTGADERLTGLAEEIDGARSAYLSAAESLSGLRSKAASRLERGVRRELQALAMEGTRVAIEVARVEEARFGLHGLDSIRFLIAPNRGEDLKPLARIASGGELSRLMLAVRNAVEARGDRRALVFDEVDSGIGGTVAEAVGQRLAALGRNQQVLCVTHLPQVAAFADRHFRVAKRTDRGRTHAEVLPLDGQSRIDELARMLGGSPPDTARKHAAALVGRTGRAIR